jgi:RNA polymerase-binding transcription factor DksA
MASQRKNPTPAKRVAPVAKKAPPKKAASKPVPPKKAAKPAPKKPATAAVKKPVKLAAKKPVKPAAKKPVAAPKAAPAKPRKLKAVARPPVAGPNVRPLGVLPASARARGSERPAAPTPVAARPAVPAPPKKGTRPRGPQRLTADELLELEEKLREERAKLMKEVGHLESTVLKVNPRDSAGDLSGYSFHMADAGTDAYERELGFQFASAEGRLLREFNEALRRLYAGEYGVCESCGSAIARARLLAIPTARLCRDCKEKEERQKPSSS